MRPTLHHANSDFKNASQMTSYLRRDQFENLSVSLPAQQRAAYDQWKNREGSASYDDGSGQV